MVAIVVRPSGDTAREFLGVRLHEGAVTGSCEKEREGSEGDMRTLKYLGKWSELWLCVWPCFIAVPLAQARLVSNNTT